MNRFTIAVLASACLVALVTAPLGAAEPVEVSDDGLERATPIPTEAPSAWRLGDDVPYPLVADWTNSLRVQVGGLVVTDDEVRRAMAWSWRELKVVVEPGGAVALASLLAGKLDVRGRTVAVVVSGGNVDAGLYCEAIASA